MSMLHTSESVSQEKFGNNVSIPAQSHTVPVDTGLQELASQLQTSLDVRSIIEHFAKYLRQQLDVDSVAYHHEVEHISHISGIEQANTLNYNLSIGKERLGYLRFSRKERWQEIEIQDLEDIICILLYPIRNAILYHRALQSSLYDPLTGIANRAGLMPSLRSELELAKRHSNDLSVLIIDIDQFKDINDNFGHGCGDYVLANIAQYVNQSIRESDLLYRYGGDEFVLVLRETGEQGALILAERIRREISEAKFSYKQAPLSLTVSIGIASNKEQNNPVTLLEAADKALYRAKDDGRNLVSL